MVPGALPSMLAAGLLELFDNRAHQRVRVHCRLGACQPSRLNLREVEQIRNQPSEPLRLCFHSGERA